jgi:hypothetical protein
VNVINISRDELITLVQGAVADSVRTLSAADAILLKRQAEQAPHLAFGIPGCVYNGKPCACPAARAGLSLAPGSTGSAFAAEFDRAVRRKFRLYRFDDGVLVVA